jgi:hypothetical protein
LAKRYQVARLYEIAAKQHDELLFDLLAKKTGASNGPESSVAWPMVLSLVARGRSDLGMVLYAESVHGTRPNSYRWSQVAALAGPDLDFEAWLSLYFQTVKSDTSNQALTDMANAYSLHDAAAAFAWYQSHESVMTAAQSGSFAYGFVLGRVGVPVESQYEGTDSARRPGTLYLHTAH